MLTFFQQKNPTIWTKCRNPNEKKNSRKKIPTRVMKICDRRKKWKLFFLFLNFDKKDPFFSSNFICNWKNISILYGIEAYETSPKKKKNLLIDLGSLSKFQKVLQIQQVEMTEIFLSSFSTVMELFNGVNDAQHLAHFYSQLSIPPVRNCLYCLSLHYTVA